MPLDAPVESASLVSGSGAVIGTVRVFSEPTGVTLRIDANGLPPGIHGVHVHSVARCDAPDFKSAGAHWNPTTKQHGRLNPNGWHIGDLPNIVVDSATGRGSMSTVVESLTLQDGLTALLDADGSAIVVHANRDDERTDTGPAGPGNSGARVACGVFRVVPP
jgi:Cu-Zn family superoxide dismutase